MTEDEAKADLVEKLLGLGMDEDAAEIVLLVGRALNGMEINQVASLIALASGVVALKMGAAHTAGMLRALADAIEQNPPPGVGP